MSSVNFEIASAVESTDAPPIPKAQAWGATYTSKTTSSLPLLDLSQGVPRSEPHPTVLSALAQTSSDPQAARYGPILGEASLRSAVAEEIKSQYRIPSSSSDEIGLNANDIGITTGCNMAFLTLMMTLCSPSTSSVLLPLPSYFNMAMTLSLQSIKPVYIPCDPKQAFTPSISAAKEYLQKANQDQSTNAVKPKAIVLITPNNPTGAVHSPKVLKEWYDLAKEYGLALVIDETYRDFVEKTKDLEGDDDGRGKPHGLFEEEDWRKTLVCLGSFSKSYRIPGHRLGYIIASPYLLKRITTICDCMQICPPRPPQLALSPLLPSLRQDITESSKTLSNRRKLFEETIKSVNGWECVSKGGFFAYVAFPSYVQSMQGTQGGQSMGSEDVARILAEECGVVVLPGSFFMPPLDDDKAWSEVVGGEVMRQDRWLRFAVANVEDETVIQLGPRLKKMNKLMGMSEE